MEKFVVAEHFLEFFTSNIKTPNRKILEKIIQIDIIFPETRNFERKIFQSIRFLFRSLSDRTSR